MSVTTGVFEGVCLEEDQFGYPLYSYSEAYLNEDSRTLGEKVRNIFSLVYNLIIKDFWATLYSIYYKVVYFFSAKRRIVNLDEFPEAAIVNGVAKAVIFIPGQGQKDPSTFFPMMEEIHHRALFFVESEQTEEDPVAIDSIVKKAEEVEEMAVKAGAERVEITIVTHSLGGVRTVRAAVEGKIRVKRIICCNARLRPIINRFFHFCKDILPYVNETYEKLRSSDKSFELNCIYGNQDRIVPEKAGAPFFADKIHIVEGAGHLGVLYRPETIQKVVEWIRK